jgi:protein-S-isoprenylcysteine O-methyltransferase Ste14
VFFVYGVACHLFFLVTYAYMAGFVGNFGVPKSIDSETSMPWAWAVTIDLILVAAFGLQHSVMARPAFKRHWTRLVPQPIERSTYVLASCIVTGLLMWQWRAVDVVVWDVQHPVGRTLLWSLFAFGWLMVPTVSLFINHFDLFGTRQVWLYLRGREYTSLPFRTPLLYAYVRHPLYVGWALAFWTTPTMTISHLLFAAPLTLYMVLASRIEERDLVAHFGRQYEAYRETVGAFVPRLARKAAPATQLSDATPNVG